MVRTAHVTWNHSELWRTAVPASLLVNGRLLTAASRGHHGLRILILILIVAAVIAVVVLLTRSPRRRAGAAAPDPHQAPPRDGG